MKSSQKALDVVLTELRAEHKEIGLDPVGCVPEVMKRLGDIGEAGSDDDWLFDSEWEPELGARPLAERLQEEAHQMIAAVPDTDWHQFRKSVEERILQETASTGLDPLLGEEGEPVAFFALLAADHEEATSGAPGEWNDFGQQVLERATSPGAGADTWGLHQLRREVEQMVEQEAPVFAGPFAHRVQDALRKADSVEGNAVKHWGDAILHTLSTWRFAMGLAASMAMLVGVMVNSRGSDSIGLYAPLSGEVSVDTVDFEGDVVMIPEEGVTMVVLTEV